MADQFQMRPEQGIGLPREIVVIGGGTGSSTIVRALTADPFSGEGVTAIATTFDDGGGTGELRKVYPDLPAVGDMRQCFDAMSELSPGALRALASRFGGGDESKMLNVKGQTLGNLLIARIIQSELSAGGTFSSALGIVGEVLQAKGKVVPPSNDIRKLVFDLPSGKRIYGEHNAEESPIKSLMGTRISFNEDPTDISEEAEAAILSADAVILAPGDLYTSVGPNLAVRGMKEALESASVVMMISNLMNRDRHTVGFTTADYAREYTRLIGSRVIERVIYSTTCPDPRALAEQAAKGSHPVHPDVEGLKRDGYVARGFDLLSRAPVILDPNDAIAATRSEIRHAPAKVAAAILGVYLNNGFAEETGN